MTNQKGLSPILAVLLIAAVIAGYLIYSGKINLPQKTSQQTTSVDETANWKTYTNTNREAGYSISYPDNWQVDDSNSENVYIFSPNKAKDNQKFHMIITVDKTTQQLGEWLKGRTVGGVCCPEDVQISSPFAINGQTFYVVLTKDGQYPGIIGQTNGKIYYLYSQSGFLDGGKYYYDQTDKVLMENINMADQIMKTIKFLDQSPINTSNWKTFTNQTFNFSFKYPSNWKIDEIPDDILGRYINFFEEGGTQIPTTNMNTRGNEIFRIMLYRDETIFDNLKEVKPISPTSITVSGKPALKSESQIDILVKNKVLHLEIISNESKKYIDQILSTFRFD